MNLIFLLSLFLSLPVATAVVQQPAPPVVVQVESGTWVNSAPADAGFTVLMPGQATVQSQPIGTDTAVENHLLTLETKLGGYVVSYVQFADEVTDPAAIKVLLDTGRDGGLKSSNGKLTSEKEIKLEGYLGREWLITLPGNLTATARAYWVKRRLYQIVFVAEPEANDTPEVAKLRQEARTRFLDSFTLISDIK